MNPIRPWAALGAVALLTFGSQALAQDTSPRERQLEDRMVNTRLVLGVKKTYAAGLTSPFVLDTTWLGHSYSDHWSPTLNWWNLHTGEVLPTTTPKPSNAMWDWDHSTGLAGHGIADSLEGWWPVRRQYDLTGGLTLPDANRPWWALDIGNQVNYVINQGNAAKRTKGVIGVWHSDPGNLAGSAVTWAPLSGTRSAWCGLRQHGDNSVVDPQTGNPFNQSTMEFNGSPRPSWKGGTATGFPGYASQWDQILYRDFQAQGGQPMTISFLYRTRMSTGVDQAPATRTGWFHGDPISLLPGNFISSTDAGLSAPIDSFMVYVGAPVNDAACVLSDGSARPVFDVRRRWFSEVFADLREPVDAILRDLQCEWRQPRGHARNDAAVQHERSGAQIDAIRLAPGNTGHVVRLAFRVKTNRGYDDENSATSAGVVYTSRGRGAAIIDDVIVNGTNVGDFEATSGINAIDNNPGVSPLNAWKSTGKPPAIYFHPHDLANLTYDDLCGPVNSPRRLCDLRGTVISVGDHDRSEAAGGDAMTAERELMSGMVSPTINLVTSGPPNPMGITPDILDATDDWYIRYDAYSGILTCSPRAAPGRSASRVIRRRSGTARSAGAPSGFRTFRCSIQDLSVSLTWKTAFPMG